MIWMNPRAVPSSFRSKGSRRTEPTNSPASTQKSRKRNADFQVSVVMASTRCMEVGRLARVFHARRRSRRREEAEGGNGGTNPPPDVGGYSQVGTRVHLGLFTRDESFSLAFERSAEGAAAGEPSGAAGCGAGSAAFVKASRRARSTAGSCGVTSA